VATFSYYPGCTLHSTSIEYDHSARAVAGALGIEFAEVPGWACCGATSAHSVNEFLAYALPAHTIANATEQTIVAPCAACYNRLRYTNHALRQDPELRGTIEKVLGRPFRTDVQIRHLLDVVANDVSPDEVKAKVQRSLGGAKVVCYYGCLLTRPREIAAFDDMEEPRSMERLLAACGAEPLDWPHRTVCCGAAFSLSRTDIVHKMTGKLLKAAMAAGADAIAVACPMCQSNLDLRQPAIRKRLNLGPAVPAVFFTQLMGWAFGFDPKKLGFGKIMVDTSNLLRKFQEGRAPSAAATK
jgi:heterodisulfide reductase subunit B